MFSRFKIVLLAVTVVPQLITGVEKLVASVTALETDAKAQIETNPVIAARVAAVRADLANVSALISQLK